MKKSKQVPAILITAVAAFAASGCGCGVTEVRRCVDTTGRILPDYMCNNGTGTYVGGGSGYYGGSSYYSRPHWVYGGSVSGSSVSGYHTTPSEGATINDSSGHTISRGGFGGGSSAAS